MANKILKDDRLYHATYGLCRVASIIKAAPPEELSYALLPVSQTRSKARFTVPHNLLKDSGFNRLVSVQDAEAILDYFKTGEKKKSAEGNAWDLAVALRAEARNKEVTKDKRKIQQLNHLVKSLTNELALVLQLPGEEILGRIQGNLKPASRVNPLVAAVLASAQTIKIC